MPKRARFGQSGEPGVRAMTRWYGRQLDGRWLIGPDHGAVRAHDPGAGRLHLHDTSKELAPEEDQGIVFSLVKGPGNSANIDYLDFYGREARQNIRQLSETDLRFA